MWLAQMTLQRNLLNELKEPLASAISLKILSLIVIQTRTIGCNVGNDFRCQ